VGALPLQAGLQPLLLWLFWRKDLLFAQPDLDQDPLILSFLGLLGAFPAVLFCFVFSIEIGAHKLFWWDWPGTTILVIFALK
jgi:hypothetical protein